MKNTQEIHEWTCPKCKKLIRSLYERQFDQMREAHLSSHDNAKKEEKEKNNMDFKSISKTVAMLFAIVAILSILIGGVFHLGLIYTEAGIFSFVLMAIFALIYYFAPKKEEGEYGN